MLALKIIPEIFHFLPKLRRGQNICLILKPEVQSSSLRCNFAFHHETAKKLHLYAIANVPIDTYLASLHIYFQYVLYVSTFCKDLLQEPG